MFLWADADINIWEFIVFFNRNTKDEQKNPNVDFLDFVFKF